MSVEFRGHSIEEKEFKTIFDENFEFDGFAEFESPALIKGKVNGEIKSLSSVYLSKTSSLNVNADCEVVSIKGDIKGKIKANTRIELLEGSYVEADLESKDMIMQTGSKFIGSCKIGETNNNEKTD